MALAPEARPIVTREVLQAWAGSAVRVGAPPPRKGPALVVPLAPPSGVPGVPTQKGQPGTEWRDAWAKVTRLLSLAVEKPPTTVFLLTRSEALRPSALPAAMRVELENVDPSSLVVRVAKEKYGRVTS